MSSFNQDYKNVRTMESPASAIVGGIAWFVLVALIWAMAASTPAWAGRYDGTSWGVGFSQAIPYDPNRCELCRAENGRPAMTECGPPTAMQPGLPYVCYCGGTTWCNAGSAPGTIMIGPGQGIGSFRADADDYWSAKQ